MRENGLRLPEPDNLAFRHVAVHSRVFSGFHVTKNLLPHTHLSFSLNVYFLNAYMAVCVCDCVRLRLCVSAELIWRVNEPWWELEVSRSADRHISFQRQAPSFSISGLLFPVSIYSSNPIFLSLVSPPASFYPFNLHPRPTPHLSFSVLPSFYFFDSTVGLGIFLTSATCESIIILHY